MSTTPDPIYRRHPLLLAILGSLFLSSLLSCNVVDESGQSYFRIREAGLDIPQSRGWQKDKEVSLDHSNEGGIALRLVRLNAPTGSPRITVQLAPLANKTNLEAFVHSNLREMNVMEQNKQIRITSVEQLPSTVGPRKSYRIHHEYLLAPDTAAIPITQVSTLLVIDGRGISVTAAGRTELFYPLAQSINKIMLGLRVYIDPAPKDKTPDNPAPPQFD